MLMTYDHWKTTNPDDEWLGPNPDECDDPEPEEYDPLVDAYHCWELAMDELHALTMRLLEDDHR
jgi:hypothetical protein